MRIILLIYRNNKNYKKTKIIVCQQVENLDEMNDFLKTQKPDKTNSQQIENLHRPITYFSMEIESVIKISQQQEQTNPAIDGFTIELY